jgi:hypothetical protein
LPHLGQVEFGCRGRTGELKNNRVLGNASDLACELFDVFGLNGTDPIELPLEATRSTVCSLEDF